MSAALQSNALIDELLTLVIRELQLSGAQHEDAREKYEAVGRWLAAEGTRVHGLNPRIYPQGSLRIGTTVRPWHHVEFDLDLVCELSPTRPITPVEAYDLLLGRMKSNGMYAPKLEPRARCIRLNYANNFHLDIVPAVPNPARTNATAILIPDREFLHWHSSNPVGYANWFEALATLPLTKRALSEARIEPLRSPEPLHHKAPLKLAVQLFKRARDVAFATHPERAPSSIILTTLAASAYQKEEDAAGALTGVLNRLLTRTPMDVRNPANPEETFTEKWRADPSLYVAFLEMVKTFRNRWLSEVINGDFVTASRALEDLFGKTIVKSALLKYADSHAEARAQNRLYVLRETGTLATAPIAGSLRVPEHIFFGGPEDE